MTAAPITENFSIKDLIHAPGPCITMVLAGDEPGSATINLSNALASVNKELKALGANAGSLLDPIPGRLESRALRGPVAILRSPDTLLIESVSADTKPLIKVGDSFDLRTLLSIADCRNSFFILALSQKRTRVLECTRASSHEVPLPPAFPPSLDDFMQTRKPDHVLDNMAVGGPSTGSMKGVMFGTSSDREDGDEYMLHFFMEIDRGVNTMLKGRNEPVVPVGVEHELALYRRVNTWAHLVEPGVHGAPDGLEGGEMHRRALELLSSQTPESVRGPLLDFDKKVGTGHASTHIQEIVAAAHEGRASHVFFQQNAQYLGTFDEIRGRVKHTNDPLDSPVDLVEDAALQTILHGGEAHVLPGSQMPNGVPVCAIFRYPATRTVGAGEQQSEG